MSIYSNSHTLSSKVHSNNISNECLVDVLTQHLWPSSSIVKSQKCIYHTCFVSSLVDDTELCIDSISYEYVTTFNFCSKIVEVQLYTLVHS